MLIGRAADLTYADVTPKAVYLNRRKFLQAMGIVGAGVQVTGWGQQRAVSDYVDLGVDYDVGERATYYSTDEDDNGCCREPSRTPGNHALPLPLDE